MVREGKLECGCRFGRGVCGAGFGSGGGGCLRMIEHWSSGDADANMPSEILTRLSGRVRAHPWWRARSRLTLSILEGAGVGPGSRVLDVGCGWGTTLAALEGAGYEVWGLDIAREMLERLDGEREGRRLIEGDLTRDWPAGASWALGGFDATLALDVLEHLDDDGAAARRLGELTRPGGVVLASVPALPELFSDFDELQGHRRRYTPEGLRAAFAGSGLELERVCWWGEALVGLARGQRRGKTEGSFAERYERYLKVPPAPFSWALEGIFRWEHSRALAGRSRRGTSLLALARRPSPG